MKCQKIHIWKSILTCQVLILNPLVVLESIVLLAIEKELVLYGPFTQEKKNVQIDAIKRTFQLNCMFSTRRVRLRKGVLSFSLALLCLVRIN
jgi:hypothetical protein